MAVLIDTPVWPWRGRLWSHLVSDVSYEELHAFVAARARHPAAGVPGRPLRHPRGPLRHRRRRRGRSRSARRELLSRLLAAGLRLRKTPARRLSRVSSAVRLARAGSRPLPGGLRRAVQRGQREQVLQDGDPAGGELLVGQVPVLGAHRGGVGRVGVGRAGQDGEVGVAEHRAVRVVRARGRARR